MDQNMHGPGEETDLDDLDPNGLIGVIKIKDGLFICDELGAQVRISLLLFKLIADAGLIAHDGSCVGWVPVLSVCVALTLCASPCL